MHSALRGLTAGDEAPASVTQRFASLVSQALEDGVLRWSRRQLLLQAADGMGICAQEAQLIIATVQENHAAGRFARTGPGAGALLATAALAQGAIAAGVLWLLA